MNKIRALLDVSRGMAALALELLADFVGGPAR